MIVVLKHKVIRLMDPFEMKSVGPGGITIVVCYYQNAVQIARFNFQPFAGIISVSVSKTIYKCFIKIDDIICTVGRTAFLVGKYPRITFFSLVFRNLNCYQVAFPKF